MDKMKFLYKREVKTACEKGSPRQLRSSGSMWEQGATLTPGRGPAEVSAPRHGLNLNPPEGPPTHTPHAWLLSRTGSANHEDLRCCWLRGQEAHVEAKRSHHKAPSWRLQEERCMDFARTAANPFESLQINARTRERWFLTTSWAFRVRVVGTVPVTCPPEEIMAMFCPEAWWIENPKTQGEKGLEQASGGQVTARL